MARLGLDYESLSAENPSLVYCALSGYGQDGPLRDRAGHDINYLALSGVLGLTGLADGPPVLSSVQIADLTGSFLATLGIVSALLARSETGRGRFVDVSMFDGALSLMTMFAANRWAGDPLPERGMEQLTGRYPCYNVYQTADGRYMSLGALEPKFWQGFCEAIGRDDLLPLQYAEGEAGREAIATLSAIFRAKDFAAWQDVAAQIDVCLEPILSLDEALAHSHTAARGMLLGTPARQLGPPLKFVGTPSQADSPAPRLGEHTAALLAELGYNSDEIAVLIQAGAATIPNTDAIVEESTL
jgi:crotonobetainyl-CoA:carnitine CoA-transferase CaiB-like acyl-CoA transferase